MYAAVTHDKCNAADGRFGAACSKWPIMSDHETLPVIGITMGDPAGIGPEIIIKGLASAHQRHEHCIPVVIGDHRVLAQTARALGSEVIIGRRRCRGRREGAGRQRGRWRGGCRRSRRGAAGLGQQQ